MFLRIVTAVLLGASLPGIASAEPSAPQLEFLMTLEAPVDLPIPIGTGRVVNIPAGGEVAGPRIRGRIVPPSGDWLRAMPDGSMRLDVRVMIETDDHEFVFAEYGGVMALGKEAAERLGKGERLAASDAYFITTPRFSTASPKYAWLNRIQAVGKMVWVQRGHAVKYEIFEVK